MPQPEDEFPTSPTDPAKTRAGGERTESDVGRPGEATEGLDPGKRETVGIRDSGSESANLGGGGAPIFAAGDLVAGRYRIVRFVARGGMGEVYEAEDAELRGRVALKTIRPEIALDHQAIERFKREIHLARQVTHPNVCRIFDIGYHRVPGGPGGPEVEITFLTMEFLPGETLDKRVRREGRLAPAQALPLLRQMVSALAAAHAMGIVHRDFKSGNVALVPPGREGDAVRAVVTDFGLARGTAAGDSFASATATGHVVGTPAYMAPEQVEGKPVTAAADVYALGVVIYEMVTGKWPFVGESSLSVAVKRLMEPPLPPRLHAPDLDPRWERVILRCLERTPTDRFARVEDVVEALGGGAVGVSRRARRRRLAWVGGILGLALLGTLGYRLATRLSLGPGATAVKARRSVAVLGFKNLTGRADVAWMSAALSEMLTSELAAGEKLRAIPGENVARMQIELKLADPDSLASDTLTRIRDRLGTDLVVLGSFFAAGKESGGQLRLDVRVQDVAAGDEVTRVSDTGTEAEILDLVSRTGAKLRNRLGVEELSEAEAGGARASLPSSPEGARLYAEGLARMRLFDALGARDLLQKAAATDPGYPMVHSALAAAWAALGYEEKAREEAKQAVDLAEKLSREDRLSVEGRYREATKEWDKAAALYRTLFSLFPDNLDYGLRLAGALTKAGEGKKALEVLESLRGLPAPARDDPRVDLAQARAAESLTDLKTQQKMAAQAATKASTQGAWLLVAEARNVEGSALLELGDAPKATAAFDEAKRLYEAAGHLEGVAVTFGALGKVKVKEGDLNSARLLFESSIAIRRKIGGEEGIAMALHNIAIILYSNGDAAGARAMIEEALKAERQSGHKNHVASELHSLGVLLEDGVDLPGARKMYEEAMRTFREIGDLKRTAAALIGTANVMMKQGDLAGARKTHDEALAISRQTGDKGQTAEVLSHLGECLMMAGDLPGARKSHEEALAIRGETGERGSATESRLSLAELGIEEGHAGEAIAPAQEAAREFADQDVPDEEARAHAVLARALLAQGQTAEARKAIEAALPLLKDTSRRDLRLLTAITAARIQAASGEKAEAAAALEGVLAEATKSGLGAVQLEARLALGELEIASGRAAEGRARLQALETAARAKGFGLVAKKAALARH
jgi:tetratricopeptide (TPR) repeat protein